MLNRFNNPFVIGGVALAVGLVVGFFIGRDYGVCTMEEQVEEAKSQLIHQAQRESRMYNSLMERIGELEAELGIEKKPDEPKPEASEEAQEPNGDDNDTTLRYPDHCGVPYYEDEFPDEDDLLDEELLAEQALIRAKEEAAIKAAYRATVDANLMDHLEEYTTPDENPAYGWRDVDEIIKDRRDFYVHGRPDIITEDEFGMVKGYTDHFLIYYLGDDRIMDEDTQCEVPRGSVQCFLQNEWIVAARNGVFEEIHSRNHDLKRDYDIIFDPGRFDVATDPMYFNVDD